MNKRSFSPSVWFPSSSAASLAGLAIASLMLSSLGAVAQVTGSSQTTTDANGKPQETVTLSASPSNKKGEKVVPSKDTKKEIQKEKKIAPGDAALPDKVLYDRALDATTLRHFDAARLDLQTLLNTYPDSQNLMMAKRDASIAAFYAVQSNNWPAAIARYETIVDTYPQYSHMDEVLIGLGDAYETEARYVRSMKLPEAAKAKLEKTYDDQAIAAYSKVVLEHSAAPHVEDARDRLDAMNVPIPTPPPQQSAASVALENRRMQDSLQPRATALVMHKPDVVLAARDGEP